MSIGLAFTHADARAAGHSDGQIARRLQRGEWLALRRGVFVDAAAYRGTEPARRHVLHTAAALRAVDGDVVASHTSAVLLHRLEMISRPPDEPVVLTRDASGVRGTRLRPGLFVHLAGLPPTHRTVVDDIAATTAARTAVDLARSLPFRDAVVVVDSALRRTSTRPWHLNRVVEDCATWPGVGRAGRAVAFADPKAESVLESLARVMFLEQGLPAPRTQVRIGDPEHGFDRVDFLWDAHRTVGEADGLAKYADPEVLRQEKLREERLREAGFEVVRFTWAQVTTQPVRTAARIRAAFARAATTAA